MNNKVIKLLKCISCGKNDLKVNVIEMHSDEDINEGIVECSQCKSWYPIENGVLELLNAPLWYAEDRINFYNKHKIHFKMLGLEFPDDEDIDINKTLEAQTLQQNHFDWYAENDTQSYNAYEKMPFWRAEDEIVFSNWKVKMKPKSLMLDIGCAQGRSAFPFKDIDLDILGFDISKKLVLQAQKRYRSESCVSKYSFMVADASNLPLVSNSIDVIVIHGALHHLPDPKETCKEVYRVLKIGGIYLGSENNESTFRKIFDILQKKKPLWHEEAGAEPLLSKKKYNTWFANLNCQTRFYNSVFLPPHFFNLMGLNNAKKLLHITDMIFNKVPILNNWGGLILIELKKLQ